MTSRLTGDLTAHILNSDQSIYNIHNPFEKHCRIAVKDMITVFGSEKWADFWLRWQEDNPNWETWIDKTIVEKTLNEK